MADKKTPAANEEVWELTDIVTEGDPEKRVSPGHEQGETPQDGIADLDSLFDEEPEEETATNERDLQSLFDELEGGAGQAVDSEQDAENGSQPEPEKDSEEFSFAAGDEHETSSVEPAQARAEAAELDAFIHGLSFDEDTAEPEQLTENVRESLETILTQDGLPESWISGLAREVSERMWPQIEAELPAHSAAQTESGAAENDELHHLRHRLDTLEKQLSDFESTASAVSEQAGGWREEFDRLDQRLRDLEQHLVRQEELAEVAATLRQEMRETIRQEAPQLAAQALRAEILALSGKNET